MQVSHFKKSLPVIVIVFMFCGCAYLKERLLDLADCVDVGIGVGAGVGVDINVTPHVGLGIGGGLAGFAAKWGRNFGTADYGFILVPFFGLVAGRARGLEEEIGDKWGTDYTRYFVMNSYGLGPTWPYDTPFIRRLYIDFIVIAPIAFRIRFHFGEFIDFIAGIFGGDPMADDKSRSVKIIEKKESGNRLEKVEPTDMGLRWEPRRKR